jgi:predicted ATPase
VRLQLKNWRNFRAADVELQDRVFVVGPNASGKSNLLDVFRFLRDLAKPEGGGLQKAIRDRGGLSKIGTSRARVAQNTDGRLRPNLPHPRGQIYRGLQMRAVLRLIHRHRPTPPLEPPRQPLE